MMYSVAVFAPEVTVDGFVVFTPTAEWRNDTKRRVTKTKTLDGNVYLNDQGFSIADRDFTFTISNPVIADIEKLDVLHKGFSNLRLANEEGVFEGAITDFRKGQSPTFTFLVSSKIS